jgi:cell division cycle 20-like protein 1 (cofactor of APC complex)
LYIASRSSKHIYSDRFIPSRVATKLDAGFHLTPDSSRSGHVNAQWNQNNNTQSDMNATDISSSSSNSSINSSTKDGSGCRHSPFSMLLKSELLGIDSPSTGHRTPAYLSYEDDSNQYTHDLSPSSSSHGHSWGQNVLRFKAPRQSMQDDIKTSMSHLSVYGYSSTRSLLSTPVDTSRRKIAKAPFKILDAPSLQDDFYLNLVDWSSTNVLAVGLGSCVYMWSACTSKVTRLCDLGPSDSVTSVAWTQRGTHLSVGTNSGEVQIWEASTCKKVRTMSGHVARVGTLAWSSQLVASGSRDRTIFMRDIRAPEPFLRKLIGHKQEVCGLKWSFDDQQLASGGNDNKLMVWNNHSIQPVVKFSDHTAAVKAIAWSPHQHGLLASGGGTADRCIRFWNTHTNTALNAIDTGSQVCNLMWSKNVNEVVSTHGYSLNQIIVWKYPSMTKLATLTGHTFRVLYLAMSPDGQTIVTGAGDETLRFWNAFPTSKNKPGSRLGTSLLFPIGTACEIR